MVELAVEVVDVRAEPFAAVPTLLWSVRLREATGVPVHALTLHAQVRIEPGRRRYDDGERDRLLELFGASHQWGTSLRPFLWTHLDTTVQGFRHETTVELPMACTYDFEVAGTKYLHALGEGEVPLIFLWSGTVFWRGESGFAAQPLAWHLESPYRLPVACWRQLMDRYFPGEGWVRMPRGTIDRLQRYRAEQALPTWEQAVASLLKAAGEDP
ncbi:MAG TPA: DUF6084 family protein [Acidimicrobiales bacterium]|nr:DUF6084 family protein [Acidimicrobiales bacterium]